MPYGSLPIIEQITQAIVSALGAIVVGQTYTIGDSATTRQWNITITAVEREKYAADGVQGNVPADLKIVLREGDDREAVPSDRNEGGGGPIRHQRWYRPFVATIYVSDGDAAIPLKQKKNVAAADVTNCLLTNRQWGGLADDTYPRGTNTQESGDDMPFVDVNFEVEYTTGENDSYSL